MTESPRYLVDVNLVVARLDEAHEHHPAATEWFARPGLDWALCPFTEAGVLRYFSRPKTGRMKISEATEMLEEMKRKVPGHHYQPIPLDWRTLTKPFFARLEGHNQITDAFLLGIAIQAEMVLTTFDEAILHLAGEYRQHVLVLKAT